MKKSMITLLALNAAITLNMHSAATNNIPTQISTLMQETGLLNGQMPNGMNNLKNDAMAAIENIPSQLQAFGSTTMGDNDLEQDLKQLSMLAMQAIKVLSAKLKVIQSNQRSNHMGSMMHEIPVQDVKGNIIGQYKVLGNVKGYRYGSFYTNVNQAPASVIESSVSPSDVAVPGATSTIIGYIENPNYNSQMNGVAGSASKMITLYQYIAQSSTKPLRA